MTVALTILTDPRRAEPRRALSVVAGTTILRAAHEAGIDVTATCGARGRCTSCRVKFVAGAVPPPTIGDELRSEEQRLNSSHMSISYAVFCLKKKKKKQKKNN